ncbi:MAG TPA: hypothetical protein VL049_05790, partial [Candidatus Dormibacteraeota bacterium]|nr:hypothetical protein [Candidatus Dormibacteraeota bacterium]
RTAKDAKRRRHDVVGGLGAWLGVLGGKNAKVPARRTTCDTTDAQKCVDGRDIAVISERCV